MFKEESRQTWEDCRVRVTGVHDVTFQNDQ